MGCGVCRHPSGCTNKTFEQTGDAAEWRWKDGEKKQKTPEALFFSTKILNENNIEQLNMLCVFKIIMYQLKIPWKISHLHSHIYIIRYIIYILEGV